MFRRKTVLVLGAGASIPYGFPSGQGLIDQITGTLEVVEKRALLEEGFDGVDYTDLQDALRKAQPASIDAFLKYRPDLRRVGKFAIALMLVRQERAGRLWQPEDNRQREELWYSRLLNLIAESPEDFASNQLSIVTFNYDRSLEQYLFQAAKNRYGLSDYDAASILSHIPITHVYGQLCPLPWQATGDTVARPYEISARATAISAAADAIRVIYEGVQSSAELNAAREWLAAAEQVYLLGCGFHHRDNMDLLGLPDLAANGKQIAASCYGYTPAEVNAFRSGVCKKMDLGKPGWTVTGFLRNHEGFLLSVRSGT